MFVVQPLISIIDDDDSLRIALAGLMRSMGYVADSYGSAEDFLRSGKSVTSACIITDIQMPGLSGIDLKERLDNSACRAPVIMITGRSEQCLSEQAVASGAFCVLKKPFEAKAIIACITRALDASAVQA